MTTRVFPRTIGSDSPSQPKWTAALLEHWELVHGVKLEVQAGRGQYSEEARWALTAQQIQGGTAGGQVMFCIDGADYSPEEVARRVGSVAYGILAGMRGGKSEAPLKSAKFRMVVLGAKDKELAAPGRTLKSEGAPVGGRGGDMTNVTMHALCRDLLRRDAEREKQFMHLIGAVGAHSETQGRMYSELVGHIKEAYESSSKAAIDALQAFVEVKIREMVVTQREADAENQGILDPQMAEWLREQMGPVLKEVPTLLKHIPDLVEMFRAKS